MQIAFGSQAIITACVEPRRARAVSRNGLLRLCLLESQYNGEQAQDEKRFAPSHVRAPIELNLKRRHTAKQVKPKARQGCNRRHIQEVMTLTSSN